MLTKPTWHRKP